MEGGKLSPMHLRSDQIKAPIRHPRRFSIAGSPHNVSIRNEIRSRCVELPTSSRGSISSTSSGGSDNNQYHNVNCGRKFPSLGNATSPFMKNSNNLSDFSQSFPGFSRQLSDPHSRSEHTTRNTGEINNYDMKNDQRCVCKDTECKDNFKPNVNQKRIIQRSSTLSSYQSDRTIQQYNASNNKSVPSNMENLSQKYFPIDFREKEETKDIYRVFKDNNIDEDQGYTGWSSNVMGLGPFGWSEQLLYGRGTSKVRVLVKKIVRIPPIIFFIYFFVLNSGI